jgi:hypothetical protein
MVEKFLHSSSLSGIMLPTRMRRFESVTVISYYNVDIWSIVFASNCTTALIVE